MDISATTSVWATNLTLAQDTGSSGFLGDQSGTTQPSAGANGEGALGPAGTSGGAKGMGGLIPIMFLMLAGMLILTSLSGRKERKKHASLLSSLGKKDKIRAAGGIIGTIIEIKNDEILIETDRASNTRIRLARSSVQSVISSKSTPVEEDSAEQSELAESK